MHVLVNIQDRRWVATDNVENKKNLKTKIILEEKYIELLLKTMMTHYLKTPCYPIFGVDYVVSKLQKTNPLINFLLKKKKIREFCKNNNQHNVLQ